MPSIAELAIIHGRPGAIADVVANAAALAAYTRFPGRIRDLDEKDVGKLVRQVDEGIVWCLIGINPTAWLPITGAGVDPETLQTAVENAVAAALEGLLPRDGSRAMAANLPFGGDRGINCADPINPQDVDTLHARNAAIAALTLDNIGPAFAINSFTLAGTNYASVVEVGTTISSLTASATYTSGPPSVATITDTAGGTWTIGGPSYASGSRGSSLTLGAVGTYTATLSATGPAGARTRTASISSAARQYWGVGAAGLTPSQVQALGNSSVSAGKIANFIVSPSNQKVYYMLPQALGTAVLWLGGFVAGFNSAQSVSVSSNGITLSYWLYESTYNQLGTSMEFDIV